MEGEKNKVLTTYQLIIIDTESRVTSPGVENLREKIESQVRVLENPYCESTSHCISGIRIIARNVVLKKNKHLYLSLHCKELDFSYFRLGRRYLTMCETREHVMQRTCHVCLNDTDSQDGDHDDLLPSPEDHHGSDGASKQHVFQCNTLEYYNIERATRPRQG